VRASHTQSLPFAFIGYYKHSRRLLTQVAYTGELRARVYLRGRMASMDFHTVSISCAASIAVTTDS